MIDPVRLERPIVIQGATNRALFRAGYSALINGLVLAP
jgi:hypothetical protein